MILFSILSHLSSMVGILVFLNERNEFKSTQNKKAALLITTGLILSFIADTVFATKAFNNFIVANIYIFTQSIWIAIVYLLIKEVKVKLVLTALSLEVMAFAGSIFHFQPLTEIQYITWTILFIVMLLLAAVSLRNLFKTFKSSITRDPRWWFSSGVAFYSLFSALIFINFPTLLELLEQEMKYMWAFHNINSIYKNLAFAGAIYWYAHNPLSPLKRR